MTSVYDPILFVVPIVSNHVGAKFQFVPAPDPTQVVVELIGSSDHVDFRTREEAKEWRGKIQHRRLVIQLGYLHANILPVEVIRDIGGTDLNRLRPTQSKKEFVKQQGAKEGGLHDYMI